MEQRTKQEVSESVMNAGTDTAEDKKSNGMKYGMIVCAVLAIAGIGFGVYEMIQTKQSKQQIADLKVEIKNNDGSTTTVETDKVEVKDDAKTLVITDTVFPSMGFVESNFNGSAEYTVTTPSYAEDGKVNTVTWPKSFTAYTDRGDRYTLYANGKVTALLGSWQEHEERDITSSFPGRVVDMAIGMHGNGGTSWVIFALEDGTAVTLWQIEPSQTSYQVYAIEGAADIVKVYGNQSGMGPLGYAQSKDGKIHTIVLDGDGSGSVWTYKIAE